MYILQASIGVPAMYLHGDVSYTSLMIGCNRGTRGMCFLREDRPLALHGQCYEGVVHFLLSKTQPWGVFGG